MRLRWLFLVLVMGVAGGKGLDARMVFRGPMGGNVQMDGQVEQIVGTINDVGGRGVILRDEAEEKLAALGPQAEEALKKAAQRHTDYQLDALEVALFRVRNGGIDPRSLVEEWAKKRAVTKAPGRIQHIQAERMAQIFVNHVFYAVDEGKAGRRSVVAVAADGKIQLLGDDAALLKFLQNELPIGDMSDGRMNAARAALVLGMARVEGGARSAAVFIERHEKNDHEMTASSLGGTVNASAVVDFDEKNQVVRVVVKAEKAAEGEAATQENSATTEAGEK